MMNQAENKGKIKSGDVIRGGISINRLLCADYCGLFCIATNQEWNKLQSLLLAYEKESG